MDPKKNKKPKEKEIEITPKQEQLNFLKNELMILNEDEKKTRAFIQVIIARRKLYNAIIKKLERLKK